MEQITMNVAKIWRLNALTLLALLLAGEILGSQAHAGNCEIRIGQREVDLGTLNYPGVEAFDQRQMLTLGTRFTSLNATCRSPSRLTLLISGNGQIDHFRLADQSKLHVHLSNALLDGRAVNLATIRSSGDLQFDGSTSLEIKPGDIVVPTIDGQGVEGSLLSLQIEISPTIARRQFETRDSTRLNSHLNFEVRPL